MKRFKVLSLAALVAFAACDEGSEPVQVQEITGTISGVVTIEGKAASGVSVALSGGASATTDASGGYSFAGVKAGTYTVTISGFATDVTFTTTTKGATIATSGQVVSVNFDGTYVRTSAILGSVAAGGKGLAGVKVALTGANTTGANVNTDANGQYAFTGLRAGTYTVTISGWDATQYAFASSTATVTVAVGQSQSASFAGTQLATSKITGSVTIDGAAAAGVTVTLSPGGTATTDATGAYTFSSLTAGTYTVTISGYASDATFSSPSQAVTIASAGSTVTANFAGVYIKTSVITGSVAVAGTGLAGVKVTLNTGASVNTDATGQYTFAALRAGTYTVTISGFDAALYTFTETSGSVTVALGQSAVKSFAGTYISTAKINGILFIDENDKNDTYDGATLEDALPTAGVAISIEGGAVNDIQNTTTDATGAYKFENLAPGTYRVTITPPAAGTFGYGGAATSFLVTLTVGGTQTVNFPFDILLQKVKVSAFLGTDATGAGLPGPRAGAAVSGVQIDLYDTQAHAAAHIGAGNPTTGRLATAATGSDGSVTFSYTRTSDASPAGTADDNIVYATLRNGTGLVPANLGANGESIIEIKFAAKDSLVTAGDEFDFLNGNVVIVYKGREIDDDKLTGWNYRVILNDTITPNVVSFGGFAASSNLVYSAVVNPAILPQTFYFDLAGAQPLANGHAFSQTAIPDKGTVRGHFLAYTHSGLKLTTDTVFVGTAQVKYLDADVVIRVHEERDDTLTYTTLDLLPAVAGDVRIYRYNGAAFQVQRAAQTTGIATFANTKVDTAYTYRARATIATIDILNDTMQAFTLSGADQSDTIHVLDGSKGFSTFMFKYNNAGVGGSLLARDATAASGVRVRVKPAANNIQPKRASNPDTTVKASAAGAFIVNGLREGPYEVTVFDSLTSSGDSIWAFLTGAVASGSKTTAVDLDGSTFNGGVNFTAWRMDTKVQGVIVNDRDADGNVIDIDEALVGAQVQLYRDGTTAGVPPAIGTGFGRDTLIATATTDAAGAYSFTKLREGRYMVRWVAGTPASPSLDVLRALSTDSVIVYTAATTAGSGANNTRVVGTTAPVTLPRWDYAASAGTGVLADPAHFMFLYKNTIARGTVKTAGAVAIAGMTVSMRRCNVSAGATSPPTNPGPQTCTSYLGTTVNVVSDASGFFEFPNLTEGVYEIRPQPTTVAGWNTSVPSTTLYLLVGNGDIEALNFVIS